MKGGNAAKRLHLGTNQKAQPAPRGSARGSSQEALAGAATCRRTCPVLPYESVLESAGQGAVRPRKLWGKALGGRGLVFTTDAILTCFGVASDCSDSATCSCTSVRIHLE